MSRVVDPPHAAAPDRTAVPHDEASGSIWAPLVAMLGGFAVVMAIPMIRERRFYWWDDSLASFTGLWDRLAQAVLSGSLPWLELDMWRGGNLPGEAGAAMFNPLVVLLAVGVHPLDDLVLRMTIIKFVLAALMASGVYALARNYGARAWPAAATAVAICATGYTMYFDLQTWVNGLLIGAIVPWFWVAVRRLQGSPAMAVGAAFLGYLLVTTGNPYGILAFGLVIVAVGAEHVAQRHFAPLKGLIAQSIIGVCWVGLVYLPLLTASKVGYRQDSHTYNDEFFSPNLSNLLGASTPLYTPYVKVFSGPIFSEPVFYIAWYLLPLLPWVRWDALRERWRSMLGLAVFGGAFLVLVLGPSQIWMFRWPGRLITMVALALLVGTAVALSLGLRAFSRGRFAVSLGIIAFGVWMAYSDAPDGKKRLALATIVVTVLVFVLVRWAQQGFRLFAVLVGGTIAVVLMNAAFFPYNRDIAYYAVSSSTQEMAQTIGQDAQGLTVVVAPRVDAAAGEAAVPDLLIGSLYAVAGVESTSSYSGIGYTAADRDLCVAYNGTTCPELWTALWATPPGEDASLADLLGVETVIVKQGYVADPVAPAGWSLAKDADQVLVFHRDAPLAYDGRVTVASPGVQVTDDRMIDRIDETLTVSTGAQSGATVTWSRLAWPGYEVTLDGEPLTLAKAPAGLLRAELPANASGTVQVTFTPPGVRLGLMGVAVGLVLTLLELLRQARIRRRGAVVVSQGAPAGPEDDAKA